MAVLRAACKDGGMEDSVMRIHAVATQPLPSSASVKPDMHECTRQVPTSHETPRAFGISVQSNLGGDDQYRTRSTSDPATFWPRRDVVTDATYWVSTAPQPPHELRSSCTSTHSKPWATHSSSVRGTVDEMGQAVMESGQRIGETSVSGATTGSWRDPSRLRMTLEVPTRKPSTLLNPCECSGAAGLSLRLVAAAAMVAGQTARAAARAAEKTEGRIVKSGEGSRDSRTSRRDDTGGDLGGGRGRKRSGLGQSRRGLSTKKTTAKMERGR